MRRYRTLKKPAVIWIIAAMLFTALPMTAGTLDAHAAAVRAPAQVKGLTLRATSYKTVRLAWNKIPGNRYTKGYAIYKDGKFIKRVNRNTRVFSVTSLSPKTRYYFRVRAYNTYKYTQYYNTTTWKWQTRRPAAEDWIGRKTRKVVGYKFGKMSAQKAIVTPAKPDKDPVFTKASLTGEKEVETNGNEYDYTIYSAGKVSWSVSDKSVAIITSTFTSTKNTTRVCSLKFKKGGIVTLTAKSALNGKKKTITIKSVDCNSTPHLTLQYQIQEGPDFLVAVDKSTVLSSGETIGTVTFLSKNTMDFVSESYNLVVENVTPRAYRTTLEDLGCSDAITMSTEVSPSNIPYIRTILDLRIQSGPGVTAIKIYDKNGKSIAKNADGEDIKTVYYFPKRSDSYDKALYDKVRKKVEESLWDDSMTIEQKLQAVAQYICDTTHYPGFGTNASNKTYWDNFSIESKTDTHGHSDYLENIMTLRGGVCDCWAAFVIVDFAEDLGFQYKGEYRQMQDISDGECYIGFGDGSTRPGFDTHATFWFTTSEGYVSYCEAEGRKHSDCETHNYRCIRDIISLK